MILWFKCGYRDEWSLTETLKCMFCSAPTSYLSRNMDIKIEACRHESAGDASSISQPK